MLSPATESKFLATIVLSPATASNLPDTNGFNNGAATARYA
jgi:hypothetical protein